MYITEEYLISHREPDPPDTDKARIATIAIKEVLEKRVIGMPVAATQCNCGAIHTEDGKVTGVYIPSEKYGVYQIACWYLWSLDVLGNHGQKYSIGLSFAIDADELENMFNEYFGELDLGGEQ